jgi:hypothetical protein
VPSPLAAGGTSTEAEPRAEPDTGAAPEGVDARGVVPGGVELGRVAAGAVGSGLVCGGARFGLVPVGVVTFGLASEGVTFGLAPGGVRLGPVPAGLVRLSVGEGSMPIGADAMGLVPGSDGLVLTGVGTVGLVVGVVPVGTPGREPRSTPAVVPGPREEALDESVPNGDHGLRPPGGVVNRAAAPATEELLPDAGVPAVAGPEPEVDTDPPPP